jgi:sulfide:quinone oxidoreductase
MDLRKLTDDLFVSAQIEPSDVALLAAQGVRAIICNRPDGESPGQPTVKSIEEAAAAHGITIVYQPVVSNAIGDGDVEAFEKALKTLAGPVLAYCRSGTRCTVLWALSEAGNRPPQEILLSAMRAGYDLSPLVQRIEERQKA